MFLVNINRYELLTMELRKVLEYSRFKVYLILNRNELIIICSYESPLVAEDENMHQLYKNVLFALRN